MASINDVFNQLVTVNASLSAIGADVNAGTVATNGVKTAVNQLDTDLKAGFASTVAALNQIAAIEIEGVKLLYHLTQQADTMICALEHISQNTCAIDTEATIQTGLQKTMRDDLDGLLAIAEAAYPAAALELERLAVLQAEIHRCCPPVVPPPACSYRPCPKPKTIGEPKLPRLPSGNTPAGRPK